MLLVSIRKSIILLIISIQCVYPAISKEWSKGEGCGFANLGGCRKDINPGEQFKAPRAYVFRNPSDQFAWRSMRAELRAGKTNNFIPLAEVHGAIAVGSDVVLMAIDYMRVCCPGGDFQGIAQHPQFGEVYIIDGGNF